MVEALTLTSSALEDAGELEDRIALLQDRAEQAAALAAGCAEALAAAGGSARHDQDRALALVERVSGLKGAAEGIGRRLAAALASVERIEAEVRGLRAGVVEAGRIADRNAAATKRVGALAERIDLVALNAAIEAVRAGEAGKGFAVVAAEMQALAAEAVAATDDLAEGCQRMHLAADEAVAAVAGTESLVACLGQEVVAAAAEIQAHVASLKDAGAEAEAAADGGPEAAAAIAGAADTLQVLSARAGEVRTLVDALVRAGG